MTGGAVESPATTSVVPVLTLEHASKWYGQVIGLNDVSLSIGPGITGLLGPNGAGKSTLMKLVTGQLKPSQGTVEVLGTPVWRHPDVYQRLGFCPDQDAFYERMTGREWVSGLLRVHGYRPDGAASLAAEAIDRVGLGEVADRKIGGYSKGMRQRIKLAQAIAHEPDVLILDEPLAGMDPLARRRVIQFIHEWGRDGRSAVVSSHILHEIESMTANVVLINQGRVLAEGDVHQIRELIDEHPHRVSVKASDPRALARRFLADDDVRSLSFEEGAVVVETVKPDRFYERLTALAASGDVGDIREVTSPDDNLQAVFQYLVGR